MNANPLGGLLRRLDFPWRPPAVPRSAPAGRVPATLGTDFDTAWARRWPARMVRAAIIELLWRPVVAAAAQPTRLGLDRLAPLDGEPAIFAANHHSHLDTPLLMTSIPEPWRHTLIVAAAADYFFPTRTKGAASALFMGAVPVERSRVGRDSAAEVSDLVRRGWSLLLYPEGGRSTDGWGQPFRGGAAYLAHRCDVPVVPVYLAGTRRILPKGQLLPAPGRTLVVFGDPVRPDPSERIRALGARIEAAVAAVADETTTDWWQARQRVHTGATPALTGPDAASWRRAWALSHRSKPRTRRWPR
ncbi:MAG: 1-acyl-sn-glycerol-3-phosphate acyltransferase [Acidimicrobiia bacterium]|nr:1-acyl-sn-glycerol-3-phosphate acyltransferase [Acidimicrobiia bacterium]MYJ14109.1 1-acyl-sn-glycerol-3-phosphate acyltransferase [Acidimicrobiia bacterium]